jgi:hypothetical protein
MRDPRFFPAPVPTVSLGRSDDPATTPAMTTNAISLGLKEE